MHACIRHASGMRTGRLHNEAAPGGGGRPWSAVRTCAHNTRHAPPVAHHHQARPGQRMHACLGAAASHARPAPHALALLACTQPRNQETSSLHTEAGCPRWARPQVQPHRLCHRRTYAQTLVPCVHMPACAGQAPIAQAAKAGRTPSSTTISLAPVCIVHAQRRQSPLDQTVPSLKESLQSVRLTTEAAFTVPSPSASPNARQLPSRCRRQASMQEPPPHTPHTHPGQQQGVVSQSHTHTTLPSRRPGRQQRPAACLAASSQG